MSFIRSLAEEDVLGSNLGQDAGYPDKGFW
jgi:hypothetical protein